MKHLTLFLFITQSAAFAQSVSLDSVSHRAGCTGEKLLVYYTSSGSFAADNSFTVQLSDANGSFNFFTNGGHATGMKDSIPFSFPNSGDHYRVRVISTDPYSISNMSNNIQIENYPSPNPEPVLRKTHALGYVGFVGDTITFQDGASELAGSSYFWQFYEDANIQKFTHSIPVITYPTPGEKTGILIVTNPAGCSSQGSFAFHMITCNPVIPDTAYIVTNTESGNHPYVWVKTGATYYAIGEYLSTVFVEPGASVEAELLSSGVYYLKKGAAYSDKLSNDGYALVILQEGMTINMPSTFSSDSIYCNDIEFDYSQVGGKNGVNEIAEPLFQIENIQKHLRITAHGEITAGLYDLLGVKKLSAYGSDMIELELSPLAEGVYFISITSGSHREVRKILVH